MIKNPYIALLILGWLAFIIWEIMVMNYAKNQDSAFTRIDLVVILPILILYTIFVLFSILRRKK